MKRTISVGLSLLCATAVALGGAGCTSDGPLREDELSTVDADGGADYFVPQLTTSSEAASFFPLGVWLPTLVDGLGVDRLRAAHLNGVVAPTQASDRSVLDGSGLWSIDDAGSVPTRATRGWFVGDELDMRFGPGAGSAEGVDTLSPRATCPSSSCGYTVLERLLASTPRDSRLRYGNFGKGVLFWETDEEASRFINTVGGVTSADAYWYTDKNLCQAAEGGKLRENSEALTAENCQVAYNYGLTVQRVRELVRPARSRPVWAFVELGHPFSQNDWPDITGQEIRAAAWASIIGGARGIVYFNNSFGGACPSADVLAADCSSQAAAAVADTNAEISDLAPVINRPAVSGFVGTPGGIYSTVRFHKGSLYLFAANKSDRQRQVRFTFPCASAPERAQVMYEGRNARFEGASLKDEFTNAESLHIYKIDGLAGCNRAAGN